MTGMEQLFAAWLAFVATRVDLTGSDLGGDGVALNPPAEVAEIARTEREIGHSLPADLHALYGIANGQPRLEGDPRYPEDAPVFAWARRFLSLEHALEERRRALGSGNEGRFDPDWYPIASNGKGGGVVIDLATDATTARGRVYGYGPAESDFREHDYSLRAWLDGMLHLGDGLSLYGETDDPLLSHLGNWYHDQVDTPNVAVETSMEEILQPWLSLDRAGAKRYEFEDYLSWVALHVGFQAHCTAHIQSTLEGVRIANDWLRERGMITEDRHRQAEAIRVDRDGARADRLEDYEFTSGKGTCGMRSKP